MSCDFPWRVEAGIEMLIQFANKSSEPMRPGQDSGNHRAGFVLRQMATVRPAL
jgi:hypothetical protein